MRSFFFILHPQVPRTRPATVQQYNHQAAVARLCLVVVLLYDYAVSSPGCRSYNARSRRRRWWKAYWYHYDDDDDDGDGSAGKRIFQIASNYESFSNIYETTRFPSGTSSLITTTPKQRMPGAWRRSLQSSTYLPL